MAVERAGRRGWRLGEAEDTAGLSGAWHALRAPTGEARRADARVPGPLALDANGDGFEEVIDLSGLASRPGAGFIIQGRSDHHYAGSSVSSAGDVNGDGFDDLIVGAPFGDDDGYDAGQAYVVFGKAGGFGTIDAADLGTAGFLIQGDNGGDKAGYSVSSAGDVNGDGFDDIIVGAPFHYDPSDRHGGDAYVIFGKATGFGTVNLAGLASRPAEGFVIHANEVGDLAGYSVSGAGDVNGDGFDDLIVGAPQAGEDQLVGGADHGEAYVIFGKAAGFSEVYLSTLDPAEDGYDPAAGFMIAAPGISPHGFGSDFDAVGFSVSGAGDVNADGYDDIIVGAPYSGGYSGNGAAAVLFGKADGFAEVDLNSLAAEDGFLLIGAPGDYAGKSVSSAGDVNGDGFDDLIVGAPYGGGTGRAYVIFGKASGFGTIDLSSLGTAGFTIIGDANVDVAGFSVSSAGDVNGDGFEDVIVGALLGDDGGTSAGEAYVVFGKAGGFGTIDLSNLGTAGFIIQGDRIGDHAGTSVSSAGDVNDDGFDDLIVGAPRGDAGAGIAGASYVIFGQAPTVAVTRTGSVIGQTIRGGDFDDTLDGREGDDLLVGYAGNDALIGGDGNDRLDGGAGVDRLEAGDGADRLSGGSEGDVFVFASLADSRGYALRSDGKKDLPDAILDFVSGEDRIDLSPIDAIAGTPANDAFTFIGTAAFTGQAGQLRFEAGDGRITILADVDGDGHADLQIVANAPLVLAGDFIL